MGTACYMWAFMLPRLPTLKLVNCGAEARCYFSSANVTNYSKYALTDTEARFDECLQALVLSQGYKQGTKMDGQNKVSCYIEVYVHRRGGPGGPPAGVP
jgi:hypothetical protein